MDKVREALETARRRLVIAARFAGNDDDVAEASVSFIDAARLRSLAGKLAEARELFENAVEQIAVMRASLEYKAQQDLLTLNNSLLARASAAESSRDAALARVVADLTRLHSALANPSIPRQSVGEMCAEALRRARTALESTDA